MSDDFRTKLAIGGLIGLVLYGLMSSSSKASAKVPTPHGELLEHTKEWAATDPAAGGVFLWGKYENNEKVLVPPPGSPPIFYINTDTFQVYDVTSDGYLFKSTSLTKSLNEYLETYR